MRRADQRAGLGLRRRTARRAGSAGARRRARRRTSSWIDSSTSSRAPAEQTWPECRKTAVSAIVEGDLEVGVGEDDVGVLAAELEGDLLHRRGGGGHDPPAGLEAAGERDQVDARVASTSGAPASGPAPSTRLPTPAGRPASSSSRIRWMAVCGVSSLGLRTKVLPAARQGATFQDDLEQRVVPRRDQAADADRLVDDPADARRALPVSTIAAGVLGGELGRSGGRPTTTSATSYSLSTSRLPVSSDSARAISAPARASRSATASAAPPAPPLVPARGRRRRRGARPRWRPRCPRRRPRRPFGPECRRPGSGSRASRHDVPTARSRRSVVQACHILRPRHGHDAVCGHRATDSDLLDTTCAVSNTMVLGAEGRQVLCPHCDRSPFARRGASPRVGLLIHEE